jgi:hypothetical protein
MKRLDSVKMSVGHINLEIYAVPVKVPPALYLEISKLSLKSVWKCQHLEDPKQFGKSKEK